MESPISPPAASSARRWTAIITGIVLIALGVWFLLETFGVVSIDLGRIWPIFPTLFGIALLTLGIATRRNRAAEGQIVVGVWALLSGLFFFLFSTGTIAWGEIARLWPTFPLIAGLGLLLGFLTGSARDWGIFIVGAIATLVGVVGYMFTFGLFSPAFAATVLPYVVPALLILGGIGFLLSALRRR